LQRRLASSPEAIYQSLRRRRERLQRRLQDLPTQQAEANAQLELFTGLQLLEEEDLVELDDAPASERQATEERILDQATTARTIAELETEIRLLAELEALALQVCNSGQGRKWEELARLFQGTPQMFNEQGQCHKLVIFTEHRDTLNYLADRIRLLLGQPEAVATIHGSMGREERKPARGADHMSMRASSHDPLPLRGFNTLPGIRQACALAGCFAVRMSPSLLRPPSRSEALSGWDCHQGRTQ